MTRTKGPVRLRALAATFGVSLEGVPDAVVNFVGHRNRRELREHAEGYSVGTIRLREIVEKELPERWREHRTLRGAALLLCEVFCVKPSIPKWDNAAQVARRVKDASRRLTLQQLVAISRLYGIDGGPRMTKGEVATKLGISEQDMEDLHQAALIVLRQPSAQRSIGRYGLVRAKSLAKVMEQEREEIISRVRLEENARANQHALVDSEFTDKWWNEFQKRLALEAELRRMKEGQDGS